MNKFITTLLCLAGSAILFNANAVEREYTQFTAFNADGSIPNGKYIMVYAPNNNTSFRCLNPTSTNNDGFNTISVTCDNNRNFTVDSSIEVTIQNAGSDKYSLISSNGQYLYTTGSTALSLTDSNNGTGFWSYVYNASGSRAQSPYPLNFYRKIKAWDYSIIYRKNTSKDFTTTSLINATYAYPTLYTVVPTLSAVASNISGIQSIANGDVLNVLKDNVAAAGGNVNVQVNYATRLEYKINGGSVQSSTSDSFSLDQAVAQEVGSTKVEVTAYDANGTAYNLNFTINVGEAPVIPQNDEAVVAGSQENTWSANVTESDATGVSLTTYNIDGSSIVEPKDNGILTISDFSLKNARYIVKASNNFLADQSLEFNFISTINNKLSDRYGDDAPYQAFIVFTNNSDRFTEGYPKSIEIPMTPNGDYTQWTCYFDKILGKSAQDLFYYIPWIALEFKIELKIVPRDSNTPMILSGKGMSVAEMPGRNREAAARISAQDSSAYSFVVDGGDTLIYKAGLSADGSTFKMIAGSAKFEPFVTNSITLSPSSNIETGISDINPDANEAEYYNLQGIRVDNPQQGIYIRRQGNKTTKVIL